MLGLVRKSKLEQLLREQLAERERIVRLLTEQVEYLRAQQGMATVTVSRALNDTPMEAFDFPENRESPDLPPAIADEADRLAAMLQAKVISQAEHDTQLEQLRSLSAEDIIE